MHYEGNLIRPPSEAGSIILQVTVGCSHNRCTFCGAYRGHPFRIKNQQTVLSDLSFAARYCSRQKTVFLADGNVLVLGRERLLDLLDLIKKQLPWVRRVSCYGNCRDILHLSPQALLELRNNGLGRIYMGLESGDDYILQQVDKGSTSHEMIKAAHLVRQSGIFLSVTSLLGLGGTSRWREHARATGQVFSAMEPNQIAILTLIPLPGTPLYQDWRHGAFFLPARETLFKELRLLIENLQGLRCQLQANHASNYFTLDGRLPRDRENFLDIIDQAINNQLPLREEHQRAL